MGASSVLSDCLGARGMLPFAPLRIIVLFWVVCPCGLRVKDFVGLFGQSAPGIAFLRASLLMIFTHEMEVLSMRVSLQTFSDHAFEIDMRKLVVDADQILQGLLCLSGPLPGAFFCFDRAPVSSPDVTPSKILRRATGAVDFGYQDHNISVGMMLRLDTERLNCREIFTFDVFGFRPYADTMNAIVALVGAIAAARQMGGDSIILDEWGLKIFDEYTDTWKRDINPLREQLSIYDLDENVDQIDLVAPAWEGYPIESIMKCANTEEMPFPKAWPVLLSRLGPVWPAFHGNSKIDAEVKRVIEVAVARVLESAGFSYHKWKEKFVRTIEGGNQAVYVSVSSAGPGFGISYRVSCTFDLECEVRCRIDGDPLEKSSVMTTFGKSFTIPSLGLIERWAGMIASSNEELELALDQVGSVIRNEWLPRLDVMEDIRGCANMMFASGVEHMDDSSDEPELSHKAIIIAKLAKDARYEELVMQRRDVLRKTGNGWEEQFERLLQVLKFY